jgi:hypothetical protein
MKEKTKKERNKKKTYVPANARGNGWAGIVGRRLWSERSDRKISGAHHEQEGPVRPPEKFSCLPLHLVVANF